MAQQVQAKQRELQSKLEAMLASVEDERLRPTRKQGFLAMAKCCDLSDPTAYQQCLQKAQLPEQRASQVVQGELNDFQSRLQRAIATCQDDVKDGSRAASDQIFFTPSSQRLLAWAYAYISGTTSHRWRGVRRDAVDAMSCRVAHIALPSQHTGGYSDQNRAQNVFNTCVGKVFDAHAGMLGDVKKCIEKGLR